MYVKLFFNCMCDIVFNNIYVRLGQPSSCIIFNLKFTYCYLLENAELPFTESYVISPTVNVYLRHRCFVNNIAHCSHRHASVWRKNFITIVYFTTWGIICIGFWTIYYSCCGTLRWLMKFEQGKYYIIVQLHKMTHS